MEAICSSETSVETWRTTRRHSPDDTLHNHRCENLKSSNFIFVICVCNTNAMSQNKRSHIEDKGIVR
jgi:hypothetical protein